MSLYKFKIQINNTQIGLVMSTVTQYSMVMSLISSTHLYYIVTYHQLNVLMYQEILGLHRSLVHLINDSNDYIIITSINST